MKNRCIIFLMSIIISVTAVFVCLPKKAALQPQTSQYLRIHIRAHSNETRAQDVKYKVRDAVVDYLTPIVADCTTKEIAMRKIAQNLQGIQTAANNVLQAQGVSYGAQASLKKENFPTRIYGEYTLPSGEYTALIISLGAGQGDNWWCVVYPPLCFVAPAGENVIYKSKIAEIIARWKANG